MAITKRSRKNQSGKKVYVYDAYVSVRGVKVAFKSFATRAEAEAWHDVTKEQYQMGREGRLSLQQILFKEVIERYQAEQLSLLRMVTQQARLKQIEYLITSPMAKVTMGDFDDRTIDAWFDWLRKHPTAKATRRKYFKQEFRILRTILYWYRDYVDPKFVVPIVKRHRKRIFYKPLVPRRPDYYMRPEEIRRWLLWLKENGPKPAYYQLAFFLVHTGARVGESAGLHWDAVDLENGIVSIMRSVWWDHFSQQPNLQACAKNDGSIRIIKLAPAVITLLKEQTADLKAPVFHDRKGELIRYTAISATFNKAFRALELPWRSTHICRHSFGTLALLATKDLSSVQAVLGHKDIRETQGYAKTVALVTGDTAAKTAELIDFSV